MRKIVIVAIVTALGAACFAVPATNEWTGAAGNGKWSDAGNWKDGIKPISGNGDTVIVNGTNGSNLENDIDNLVITRIFLIGSATVSGYAGNRVHFDLLKADSVEGAFADGDIEVVGDVAGRKALVEQCQGTFRLLIPKGFCFILK